MGMLRAQGYAFEKVGIDEAYLDVSAASNGNFHNAQLIATNLKQKILRQEHITCSIGIGPNKLVAKIASAHVKPDGLTIVEPGQIQAFLNGQAVSIIPGIGKKIEEKFTQINIQTIDELVRLNPTILHEKFGSRLGNYLFQAARGEDNEEVRDREVPTQFSRVGTLKENTRDFQLISHLLTELTHGVCNKLQENQMICKSVSIVAILDNLTVHTKSATLESATNDIQMLTETSARLMHQFLDSTPHVNMRRIGVKVSGLSKQTGQKNIESFFRN
jgi:DNA polymerase IV (DinB-like DNA polymerase)